MEDNPQGVAFVFGDDINTSVIAPTEMLEDSENVLTGDITEYLFNPIAPDFTDRIETGDIIVAGENFGSGSARDTAPLAIKRAEIGAVVADSFARIFYRNAIALGLPVFASPGVTDVVTEGDAVEIDLEDEVVRNLSTEKENSFNGYPDELQEVVDAGGLLPHYQQHPEGLTE